MKALYLVMDVEGGNPQLAPASSQVKETAFSQDELMYSHPFDGGPIPPANRRRAASLPAYSRPMLVDSSSSDDESLPPLVTDSSSSEDESLPPLVTDIPYMGEKECEKSLEEIISTVSNLTDAYQSRVRCCGRSGEYWNRNTAQWEAINGALNASRQRHAMAYSQDPDRMLPPKSLREVISFFFTYVGI